MTASPEKGRRKTDWAKVEATTAEEIDAHQIEDEGRVRHLDKEWFDRASRDVPEPKVSITIRVDKHVLDYFKGEGAGYQTRMNAVLAAFVADQERHSRPSKSRR
ncbi:BrnA antitoxin family protein [Inquilinus limosus]|uniref:BrnA antitoxin family protein n=1 Tax=Inquilinus limosus TaxID=171674 RepID=UPI003F5CC233